MTNPPPNEPITPGDIEYYRKRYHYDLHVQRMLNEIERLQGIVSLTYKPEDQKMLGDLLAAGLIRK